MKKTGNIVSGIQYLLQNTLSAFFKTFIIKNSILNKRYLVVMLTLVTAIGFAQDDVRLVAKVSKKTLGENQRLRLSYEINHQEADDFQLPNFKNFKVVQGPSQSVSNSYSSVNGRVQSYFSKTYTYILEPRKKGVFTLPAASITFEGEKIESNTLTIKVVDPIDIPADPNDPRYLANQNVKMVVSVSKQNPYVGEPIYAEYRLYVNQMGINGFNVDTPPNYEGFWSQQIENKNPQFKEGEYKGEVWRYAVLHKVLLIPQSDGTLTINPMSADVVVGVPTGRGDFFGNMITRNVDLKLSSDLKKIKVKTLPLEGKPLDFTGAVGDFKYDVTTSRDVFKANESAQVKVKVSGKGNLKLFEIPNIKTPKELEVYEPERKEKVNTITSGLRGSIEEAYTVVPQYKGKFIIPSTTFSYFNPKEKKYHTISSDEIVLNVTEGKELVTGASADYSNGNDVIKQSVKSTGENFRYIQTSTELSSMQKDDFFKSKLFYVLLLLPLVVIPVGVFASKKQRALSKDIKRTKLKTADKLARKYLASAKKQLGNKETFYGSLEKALHNYLKAKLSVETTDISKDKIDEMLVKRGASKEVTKAFLDVFTACEFARYAPSSDDQMKGDFDRAKKAMALVDKNI